MLALRVPGGFSNDLGGAVVGQRLVYGRAFLMQIICIRDIYPSKPNGKQQVAKIYPPQNTVNQKLDPRKTLCFRSSNVKNT